MAPPCNPPEVAAEAKAAHDAIVEVLSLTTQGYALAYQGETGAALAAAEAAALAAADLGGLAAAVASGALTVAAVAAGDLATAQSASDAAWRHYSVLPTTAVLGRVISAEVALAGGDLVGARRWADEAVATATGWWLMLALSGRARVAIVQGEPEQAERDAHDALAITARIHAYFGIFDTLECLGTLASDAGSHREAARLFGAAHGVRQRMGAVRFKVYEAGFEASMTALRDAMEEKDFDVAWAEGAALSTDEAIAYAQRGRGQRKRPASGWASLTPTERDVVRLVSEGLGNNDIAGRLFVSPRTVQTHLTHVYNKLGLRSRVQLAQEAARHD